MCNGFHAFLEIVFKKHNSSPVNYEFSLKLRISDDIYILGYSNKKLFLIILNHLDQ